MNTLTFTLNIIFIKKVAVQFIRSPCLFLADRGGCVITLEDLGGRSFLYSNKTKKEANEFLCIVFFSNPSS